MGEYKEYRAKLGGDELVIGTGKLAQQAGGAVTVRVGDSMVLVTATASKLPRPGTDFFPLTVDLEERRASAGKIPGGFFKREGRLSTESILLCRSIDRPIRPLFPEGYRNDVQVVVTPLSVDQEHEIDALAMNGASIALTISDIPFGGPIGAISVGCLDGELILNPTTGQMAASTLDLKLAGTRESVLMIETGAQQVDEALLMRALRLGHEAIQDIITLQEQMRAEIGKEKNPGVQHVLDPELLATVRSVAEGQLAEIVADGMDRSDRHEKEAAIRQQIVERLGEVEEAAFTEAYEVVFRDVMRRHILDTGKRVDGRDLRTIRPLSCEVGLLPRTHGSGLFNRGETQVLTTVTLGTSVDEQTVEHLSGEQSSERYMHHYNFPPYSTGEAGFMRGPKRREIGHGALAERALVPVLPSVEAFPYTIRLVSDALSSNGSTSMASTCASTLALLDAGVPIKASVAGIAMGVITEGDRYAVLTDIQGVEDHLGDMDFKVTGTAQGVTAIQLDIKIGGLRWEIIEETLSRSREARLQILDVMNAVLPAPRAELSDYAPRIQTVKIPIDKIGALIGPGGKTIRGIIEETGVTINVEDDGTVLVASNDGEASKKALERITALTAVPEIGRIYTGKVVRVTDFGAFVEIFPGQDGLVHISQLADFHVNKVEDVVREGDETTVMVVDVSPDGKIRLSRQAVLQGWTVEEARQNDSRPSGGSRSRRDDNRGSDRGRGGYRDRR